MEIPGPSPSGVEDRVVAVLAASGVPYELLACDPAFADTAAFCDRYGVPPEASANTIVVASKKEPKRYVACVVLATTRLDVNGAVKRRMGAGKVSFASPEETAALTGMLIGGVTPLALPPGVPVWVDERVMHRPEVVLGGGSRSLKVRVPPDLFRRVPGTEIVPGLATPISPEG